MQTRRRDDLTALLADSKPERENDSEGGYVDTDGGNDEGGCDDNSSASVKLLDATSPNENQNELLLCGCG